jgi:hypothetical protein
VLGFKQCMGPMHDPRHPEGISGSEARHALVQFAACIGQS